MKRNNPIVNELMVLIEHPLRSVAFKFFTCSFLKGVFKAVYLLLFLLPVWEYPKKMPLKVATQAQLQDNKTPVKCLPCARPYPKYFIWFTSFNIHQNPMKYVLELSSECRELRWSLSNRSNHRTGIWFQSPCA